MCTTLEKQGNLTNDPDHPDPDERDKCKGWTSCEEWCLSKVSEKNLRTYSSSNVEVSIKRSRNEIKH